MNRDGGMERWKRGKQSTVGLGERVISNFRLDFAQDAAKAYRQWILVNRTAFGNSIIAARREKRFILK